MKNDFREYYDVDYILHSALSDDELMHFGVEGMKWGVRRYQNPDGSLTPLGAQHYGKQLASMRNSTKSNYADYKAYAKKEIDRELKGKNTKSAGKKKDRYYKRYLNDLEKENSFKEKHFNKDSVKKLVTEDDPHKIKMNKNYSMRTMRDTYLFGLAPSVVNDLLLDKVNGKYYDSKTNTQITGQNMFVTLKDGRVIPIDLGMLRGGVKIRNKKNDTLPMPDKNDILEKEFQKRYKKRGK